MQKLMSVGAKLYQPVRGHNGGPGRFVTASVRDLYGSIGALYYSSKSIVNMETKDGRQAILARTREACRNWLLENSQSQKGIWVILYHKKSKVPGIDINEATEEALCFGWIDSLAKKRDAESYYLTFTPRNLKSKWSKPNRDRAEKMISQGLMTEHGQKMIDVAKQSGRYFPE